jgi:type IV pilus assembly protein PilP
MNKIKSIVFFVMLPAVILLSGCDNNSKFKDLQSYIDDLKKSESKETKSKTDEFKDGPPVSVKYSSMTLRSPFEVLEAAPAKGKVATNPLQAYPLDMLRFVGTVTKEGRTIAFVSAPDNRIYQIKVGDVIGDHDSEVVKIESDRISLNEQYMEDGNTPMKRVVTLQLKEASK